MSNGFGQLTSYSSFLSYAKGNQWPEPPSPLIYHGMAGDLVKALEPHTEADPVAILVQLLVLFGNLAGRRAYFAVEADKHYPNLFAVLVGETGKGRKGTSWNYVERVAQAVIEKWTRENILKGLSTGEGLVFAVRDSNEPKDKRVLVKESEYVAVLQNFQRQGNKLSPMLRDAWDHGNLRTMTKKDPLSATNAHISIVGHITKDELRRNLTSTEMANGFANRFLWVCTRRSKVLPDGGSVDWEGLQPLINSFKDAVGAVTNVTEVRKDAEATELWREVYPDLSEGKPGVFGAVTSRAEAQVMRLALVYALLDSSTQIRKVHLKAALALWEYCEDSVRHIFGDLLGDPVADKILQRLRSTPEGLTRTAISTEVFSKNLPMVHRDRALDVLETYGMAYRQKESGDGRPEERWFATTRKTKETKKDELKQERKGKEASFLSGSAKPIASSMIEAEYSAPSSSQSQTMM